MTIQEFKNKATKEAFNSNNAWGFGGSIGFYYTIENLVIKDGQWCYRHSKPEKFNRFFIDDKEVLKKDFEAYILSK